MGTLTRLPIKPIITIKKNDNSFYTFNPFTDTFDFRLTDVLEVFPAFDNIGGHMDFTIIAPEDPPANATMNTLLANFVEGNEVLISLGKKPTLLLGDCLLGKIEHKEVYEPTKKFMMCNIYGLDWFSDIAMGRKISLFLEQNRLADGKTPDPADEKTKLVNIVRTLLGVDKDGNTDRSAYPGPTKDSLQRITAIEQGVVLDPTLLLDKGSSVPNFNAQFVSLQDALNNVDDMDDTIHYGLPNKKFVRKQPGDLTASPPDILITDDPNDPFITLYTYYALMSPGARYRWTVETQRKRLFALDSGNGQADPTASKETNTGSVLINDKFLAIQFQPTYRNCSAIALFCSKVGNPPDSLQVELLEDRDNLPLGSGIAEGEKVADRIGTTLGWHYFSVNKNINTAVKHWIVVRPPNQVSDINNCYKWGKDSAVNARNADSVDGIAWTPQASSYNLNFRIDFTDKIASILPASGIAANDKHLWEEAIQNPTLTNDDTMTKYLTTQYATLKQRKEILSCKITVPDCILQNGQPARVRKQKFGLVIDGVYTLSGIKYLFTASAAESTGISHMPIVASKYSPYP